jgi:hypothetical protein
MKCGKKLGSEKFFEFLFFHFFSSPIEARNQNIADIARNGEFVIAAVESNMTPQRV